MPYFSDADLPPAVRNNLPKHARELYRKAFNHAWDSYRDPATLPLRTSRVELAAKIAWAAVKQEYKKGRRGWIKKGTLCQFEQLEIFDISWPLIPGITEYAGRKELTFDAFGKRN